MMNPTEEQIQDFINNKTKPIGSLGRLEELAAQLARVQNRLDPVMERAQLLLFAGDHGLVAEGVSAYPQAVTAQMVSNFLAGGAAANVFARANGVEVVVVDAGVATDLAEHTALVPNKVALGTKNTLNTPAMSAAEFQNAWQKGALLGEATETDAILLGEMGIGNTSAAALVAHKLSNHPLHDLTGPGTGLDQAGLSNKITVLEKAAARTARHLSGHQALREYGGFEMVMMAGAAEAAAKTGKLVVVDGVIATSTIMALLHHAPELRAAMVFAHRSGEHGHEAMLASLNAQPLLDLGMRLGEGSGALLAWPLVRAAARMMREMASFESAAVSGPV